jgi:hypothetical protein
MIHEQRRIQKLAAWWHFLLAAGALGGVVYHLVATFEHFREAKMQVGDRVTHRDSEMTIQWVGNELATAVDAEERSVTAAHSKFKPVKRRMNVEAAQRLIGFVRSLRISGNPDVHEKSSQFISENTSLTEIEAADYFRPTTERSHNVKFDVEAPNAPAELVAQLGVALDSRTFAREVLQAGIMPVRYTPSAS